LGSKYAIIVAMMMGIFASAAYAERIVYRSFEVSEAAKLILEVEPARVFIEQGDSSEILVRARFPDGNLYDLDVEKEGDDVTVKLSTQGTLGILLRRMRLYTGDEIIIEVWVPQDCQLFLETQSGRMEIDGVHGEISLSSGSGLAKVIGWFFKLTE